MPDRAVLPWRTGQGPRPAGLPLPPARMPLVRRGRPLKTWRYVGVFGPELSLCAAVARIGVATVAWWAVWDRAHRVLADRTRRTARGVDVAPGRLRVRDRLAEIDLVLAEGDGVETVSPHGAAHIWTRKQGGVPARGSVTVAGRTLAVDARAIVDESAGYHARETAWRWAAGVGTAASGAPVAWNLVSGIHDDADASERTVWVDGVPHHAGPATFAPGLDGVRTADGGDLRFAAEATRRHREDLWIARSAYEQPFGTATGTLPHAGALREGHGVMERHEVRW